ncbi:transglycosylase SLT domain-containing protein [Salinivibrio sp. YCSC6]|uniref:transglycosylase SLT domain-containing protein n=1 Tax=Salinivibrio sp. YCSC6 TaxID=2003370 RepID=UPI000BBBE07D|nr:transporter substrate-binding domain-containing protein [Salinivibrio sp. YCSC6]PCE65291.1 hypothetical protein B6G00_15010 [Salinivibrio sp. YCSC6]QCF37669.1 transporter substrate-binding domain-containing protein [Salinivibrio sp. YCSC6]
MHYLTFTRTSLLVALTCFVLLACKPNDPPSDLALIQSRGELVIATRLDGVGCYYVQDKVAGRECALLSGFAEHLGIALTINKQPTVAAIIDRLNQGHADIGAADLTQTTQRERQVHFSAPLFETREVLVQRSDNPIGRIADLVGHTVSLRKSSAYVGELMRAAKRAGVNIGPTADANTIGLHYVDEHTATLALVADVAEKEIDFTVADEHIARNANVRDNNLDVSLVFGAPRNVGFVVSKYGDGSLLDALNWWLQSDAAQRIHDTYHQQQTAPDTTQTRTFLSSSSTLSPWDPIFQRYENAPFDWQWLAAQSYVESRFRADAVSPAGAMGLMQLMPPTAKEMGVTQPFDPAMNIRGGARYNHRMYKRWHHLPAQDALAFSLASYNAGLGHVLDARALARADGADPDNWFSSSTQRGVEDYITELEHQAVYQRPDIRYGYCRGSEPKHYVQRIFRQRKHYADLTGDGELFPDASTPAHSAP